MLRQGKVRVGLKEKVAVLKKYEVYSYQIAYHLLKSEEKAIQAASQTLLELGSDDEFFLAMETSQMEKLKSLTIKKSIQVRAACHNN